MAIEEIKKLTREEILKKFKHLGLKPYPSADTEEMRNILIDLYKITRNVI